MHGKIVSFLRRKRWWLVFGTCLLLGVALAGWFPHGRGGESPPRLDVSLTDLDLGEVYLQSELDFRLSIRNQTSDDIVVEELTASCNCTELSPSSFTVPARGKTIVHGTIDLTRSVPNSNAQREPFLVMLTAQVAGSSGERFDWPLRGTALRVLDVEPNSIDLQGANEVIAGTGGPTIAIRITPRIELADVKPEWPHDEAQIDFSGPDEEGSYRLQYTPGPNFPRGPVETRVNLRTKLPDGTNGPDLEIPVRGVAVPLVRLYPAQVTIFNRPAPETGAEPSRVYLVRRDETDWEIVEILDRPDWLLIDRSRPGQLSLDVSGRPEAGETAELLVVLRSSAGRRVSLPCYVSLTQWLGETEFAERRSK